MKNPKGVLHSIKHRQARSGADYDYIDQLSDEEAAWLAEFSKGYYEGNTPNKELKKEANQRRYKAHQSDALSSKGVALHGESEAATLIDSQPSPEFLAMCLEEIDRNKD